MQHSPSCVCVLASSYLAALAALQSLKQPWGRKKMESQYAAQLQGALAAAVCRCHPCLRIARAPLLLPRLVCVSKHHAEHMLCSMLSFSRSQPARACPAVAMLPACLLLPPFRFQPHCTRLTKPARQTSCCHGTTGSWSARWRRVAAPSRSCLPSPSSSRWSRQGMPETAGSTALHAAVSCLLGVAAGQSCWSSWRHRRWTWAACLGGFRGCSTARQLTMAPAWRLQLPSSRSTVPTQPRHAPEPAPSLSLPPRSTGQDYVRVFQPLLLEECAAQMLRGQEEGQVLTSQASSQRVWGGLSRPVGCTWPGTSADSVQQVLGGGLALRSGLTCPLWLCWPGLPQDSCPPAFAAVCSRRW